MADEKQWECSFYWDKNKAFLLLSEIAEEKEHKFTFDIPENLPEGREEEILKNMKNELVKTYGKGGIAFFDNYMLQIDANYIYKVGHNVMDEIVKFLSDPGIIKREWDNEPFEDNFDWTDAERYAEIKKYIHSLKKRFV